MKGFPFSSALAYIIIYTVIYFKNPGHIRITDFKMKKTKYIFPLFENQQKDSLVVTFTLEQLEELLY